jgi:hypothetical protein
MNFEGSSSLRYYSGLHDVTTSQYGGSMDSQFVTSPRVKFNLAAAGSYNPSYQDSAGQSSARDRFRRPSRIFRCHASVWPITAASAP